ncbi:MAG: N-acetyl-gamma-glutamyl-phosphate reductase, partial [Acutalibacter sp.]|nr:N-acetyl-gamma-glutamyl-phosphate reductase [Acutalibacter sp.]
EYYQGQRFIQVAKTGDPAAASGFLAGNGMSGWDGLKIYATGNSERIVVSAQFDNLGKGASGAAIQCMNLALGCSEAEGLCL